MTKAAMMNVPLVATRGIVVFPGQDVMIEVGRQKSVTAVNTANDNYDAMVFIDCQKDIQIEDPKMDDLYAVGTLAKIKIIRRKEGYLRVTFTGMKRARLVSMSDDGNCWCSNNRVTCMNTNRIKVFHVADNNGIVLVVTHDFIFNFLISGNRLFY